jgi:hypothetical protein
LKIRPHWDGRFPTFWGIETAGPAVIEGIVVDALIGIVMPIIEELGADMVAPDTFETASLTAGEIIVSTALVVFDVLEGPDALLLLFAFTLSMLLFLFVFLGGGLTISGSFFPLLKNMH